MLSTHGDYLRVGLHLFRCFEYRLIGELFIFKVYHQTDITVHNGTVDGGLIIAVGWLSVHTLKVYGSLSTLI